MTAPAALVMAKAPRVLELSLQAAVGAELFPRDIAALLR